MGRPRKAEKKVSYTIMLEPTIIGEIKGMAARAEIEPGVFARNVLKTGLDDARLLDKVGLLRLIGSSKRQIEKVKKQFNISWDNIDIFKEK